MRCNPSSGEPVPRLTSYISRGAELIHIDQFIFGIQFSRYRQEDLLFFDRFASAIRDQELSLLLSHRLCDLIQDRLAGLARDVHVRSTSSSVRVCDLLNKSGSRLLFHTVSSIVPSAVQVLTVVFGMRTGDENGCCPCAHRHQTDLTLLDPAQSRNAPHFGLIPSRGASRLVRPGRWDPSSGEPVPRPMSSISRGAGFLTHDNLPETQPLLLSLERR